MSLVQVSTFSSVDRSDGHTLIFRTSSASTIRTMPLIAAAIQPGGPPTAAVGPAAMMNAPPILSTNNAIDSAALSDGLLTLRSVGVGAMLSEPSGIA
jgi:hypothetical protein